MYDQDVLLLSVLAVKEMLAVLGLANHSFLVVLMIPGSDIQCVCNVKARNRNDAVILYCRKRDIFIRNIREHISIYHKIFFIIYV